MHVGSDNLDMSLLYLTFEDNTAGKDGGALSLMFDNLHFSVRYSTFHRNLADESGKP
jgi:hypothetical protein